MVEALITALLILIFYVIPAVVVYIYTRKIYMEIIDADLLGVSDLVFMLFPVINIAGAMATVGFYRESSGKKSSPKLIRKFFRI